MKNEVIYFIRHLRLAYVKLFHTKDNVNWRSRRLKGTALTVRSKPWWSVKPGGLRTFIKAPGAFSTAEVRLGGLRHKYIFLIEA